MERRGLEDLPLERFQAGETGGVDAPARVGAAAERAQLGAGRVDQDAVGVAGWPDLDLCPGPRGPRFEAVEALRVGVAGVDLPPLRGEEQRLAARAGAEVEHGLAGARRDQQAHELAALVLRLEPAAAPAFAAEEVRARGRHHEAVGRAARGPRFDAVAREPVGQLDAGAAEPVGAQADGSRLGDGGAEGLGLGAQLALERRFQPVGERPPVRQPPRLT